jgi:hypothetical protein
MKVILMIDYALMTIGLSLLVRLGCVCLRCKCRVQFEYSGKDN